MSESEAIMYDDAMQLLKKDEYFIELIDRLANIPLINPVSFTQVEDLLRKCES